MAGALTTHTPPLRNHIAMDTAPEKVEAANAFFRERIPGGKFELVVRSS